MEGGEEEEEEEKMKRGAIDTTLSEIRKGNNV